MRYHDIQLTGSLQITGSLTLPAGTTEERPTNPRSGSVRLNTTLGVMEIYTADSGSEWVTVGEQAIAPDVSRDIEYLLVAGGGGGGRYGGGGAGGLLSSSLASVSSGSSFTVTIGSSGAGTNTAAGSSGQDSTIVGTSISTITAVGGGGGGEDNNDVATNGGSGGGSGHSSNANGSGTTGQGNDGGTAVAAVPNSYSGAGGGGAGEVGGSANTATVAGNGGDGKQSSIIGTPTYYAGGGGGSTFDNSDTAGTGGTGGGGNGPKYNLQSAISIAGSTGTINTGGGGGGAYNGGSGVAIFAYDSGSLSGLGGVKSSRADGYVVHTFNDSGTLTIGGPSDNPVIPQNNFNALVYTGNHSYPRNINVGFIPDLVWVKNNGTGHHWRWFDITRGTAPIYPNNTAAEDNYNDGPEMIVNGHANGFTIIDNPDGPNVGGYGVNENSSEIAAYCWKGGPTGSNDDGGITSTVSVNNSTGFSIVSYTGNLSTATTATAQSVGHGLNKAPEIIFFLNRGGATQRVAGTFGSNWSDLLPLPGTAAAKTDYYSTYPMADPTDSVFYTNYISAINVNNNNHVAYCFHSVPGFSKIGTYTGTAGPNNQIDVGFKPKMVIIKSLAAQDWNVFDAARETSNPKNYALKLNSSATEATESAFVINFNSTGFELDGSGGAGGEGQINASNSTYLYLAFAE